MTEAFIQSNLDHPNVLRMCWIDLPTGALRPGLGLHRSGGHGAVPVQQQCRIDGQGRVHAWHRIRDELPAWTTSSDHPRGSEDEECPRVEYCYGKGRVNRGYSWRSLIMVPGLWTENKSAMALGLDKRETRFSPFCERIDIRNHQNQQCIADRLVTIAQINIVRICIASKPENWIQKIKFKWPIIIEIRAYFWHLIRWDCRTPFFSAELRTFYRANLIWSRYGSQLLQTFFGWTFQFTD